MIRIDTFKELFQPSFFFIYKSIHDQLILNETNYSLDDPILEVTGATVNIVENKDDLQEIERILENYPAEIIDYTEDKQYLYLYIVTNNDGGPLYFVHKDVCDLSTLVP